MVGGAVSIPKRIGMFIGTNPLILQGLETIYAASFVLESINLTD